ncbi:MAG: hypothetical protein L3J02_01130 [Henriciella sp.]|nr:hypothetical protein [Henriciella sp.]
MSFHEKTAWVMGIVMIVAGAYYFNLVARASSALGGVSPPVIGFVIAYIVFVVIASIIAMSALGIANHREANAPADEREKRALDKAGHWSGYVMAFGVISGLMHYSVKQDGNMLFHIAFGSLMLSQISEYMLQILFFRRGT